MVSFDPKTRKIALVALHLLAWGFWFIAPMLFMFNGNGRLDHRFIYQMWIPMIFSVALFYLNYFIIIEKFLFRRRVIWFILINIVLIAISSFVIDETFKLLPPREPLIDVFKHRPPKIFFGRHNLSLFFIVSISVAIRTTSRWFATESQRKNLENEHLRSELSNLKNQLNPHFFFNTLNNIYSLIQSAPDKAQESVHGLAKLMRYHLYETNEERVPLAGEMEIMRNYVALMQLRLSANVVVETSFVIEDPQTQIAPLLFIPLIENSFKHGVNPSEDSRIAIRLEEKNHLVTFETYNTNSPQHYQNDANRGSNGIGMENLQKRLALIYPGKHVFVKDFVGNLFHVKVSIQL